MNEKPRLDEDNSEFMKTPRHQGSKFQPFTSRAQSRNQIKTLLLFNTVSCL